MRVSGILLVAVLVLLPIRAYADVSVFSDDFSANTIGTNWTVDVSGEGNYAGISTDWGAAYNLANNGYAGLYSKSFNASGQVNFSGQLLSGNLGLLPFLTQWSEISIYNSNDPTKYFRASYSPLWNRLRLEDSGQLLDDIEWTNQPSYKWVGYGLVFDGSQWAFFQDASLVKLYNTTTMQGADSYYVSLLTRDDPSLNNGSLFDNVCVNASAVPEPVSTTLFLLGGAVMAVKRLRRK